VCLLPGRTRHAFTDVAVQAIAGWLATRVGRGSAAATVPPNGCLEEETAR